MQAKSIAWLLPLLLTACMHKNHPSSPPPLAPPIEDTPPPKPVPSPTELPPPMITIPQENPTPKPQPQQAPAPPPRHKRQPSKSTPPPAAQPPQAEPSSVSAVGQLSSGDPSDLRRQTGDSINEVQRGLNGLHRRLNDSEQKTAAQIREFLKQAREALNSGDIDGAHTLAVKAKVLLGELSS